MGEFASKSIMLEKLAEQNDIRSGVLTALVGINSLIDQVEAGEVALDAHAEWDDLQRLIAQLAITNNLEHDQDFILAFAKVRTRLDHAYQEAGFEPEIGFAILAATWKIQHLALSAHESHIVEIYSPPYSETWATVFKKELSRILEPLDYVNHQESEFRVAMIGTNDDWKHFLEVLTGEATKQMINIDFDTDMVLNEGRRYFLNLHS